MTRESDRIAFGDIERVFSFEWNPTRLKRDASWKEDLARRQADIANALRGSTYVLDSCPICGGVNTKPFAEIHGFPYHRCGCCGHVFLQEAPTPEALNALYSAKSNDLKSVHMSIYGDPRVAKVRVELIARPKVAFVTERVSRVGTWVDVGCGTGEILVAAQEQGWAAVGIESDVDEVAFARERGCTVHEAYLTQENASENVQGADVVSLFNVLEHIPRPMDLVHSVVTAMDQGSYLVLELPRHPSLSSLANRAFPRLAHRHMYAPDHLHVFTEKSAQEMLRRVGVVPRAIWVFGQDFSEAVYSMASSSKGAIDVSQEIDVDDLNAIQKVVDRQGLSDKMIVLCERE